MKKYFVLLIGILSLFQLQAQNGDNAYGFLGGLTIGTQNWNGADRDPLFSYNGRAFTESYLAENTTFFGELGYHVKGSSIFSQGINLSGQTIRRTYKMKFNNLSLVAGGRRIYQRSDKLGVYGKFGLRLEYTISDTLEIYSNFSEGVNKFNYGATLGGGFIFGHKDGGLQFILDIQVSPDFSQQIFIPPGSYFNRFSQTYVMFGESRVRNLAIEISLGVRFVNKYLDEEDGTVGKWH